MNRYVKDWFVLTVGALSLIALTKIAAIIYFGDIDFEPDSYLHFLQTADLFHNFPANLETGLSVWAKPLYTYLFGLLLLPFSGSGIIAAQLINVVISALAGLAIFAVARKVGLPGKYALLAAVLSNAGFIFFRAGMGSLTEPLFALLFCLAILAWLRGQYTLSSLIIGISVLGRLEALLFVGIWGLALFVMNWKKQTTTADKTNDIFALPTKALHTLIKILPHIFMLVMPVIIWNFIGYLNSGEILYLFARGYPKTAGVYGYGNPLTYIEGLIHQEPLLVTLLALAVAIWLGNLVNKFRMKATNSIRGNLRSTGESTLSQLSSAQALIWIVIIVFIAVQTILYTLGLFGTAGLMRYFAVIIPVFAVPAAWGAWQLTRTQVHPSQLLIVAVLCVMQLGISLIIVKTGGFYKGLYNRPEIDQRLISIWNEPTVQLAAEKSEFIYASRPELIYYSQNPNNGDKRYRLSDVVDTSLPVGTIVLVDLDWYQHGSGRAFPLASPSQAFDLQAAKCKGAQLPTKLIEVEIPEEYKQSLRVYYTATTQDCT
jgi:hypothetical protein